MRKKKPLASRAAKPSKTPKKARSAPPTNTAFPIVGVGASAGGLEAFTQLLRVLPNDTGMGFVLVQHLDPQHKSALAQILSRATTMPVREITNGQRVRPNHVHVIPRDTTLRISDGVLKLVPRGRARIPHRPVDAFFDSLAQDRKERAIGIVLSGTASDGTLGLEAIKAEGGITFAQDDSAKHDSMPRSAIAAGCVDLVLSPHEIASELAQIAKHPYVAGQPLTLTTLSLEGAEEGGGSPELDRAYATKHAHDDTPLPPGGSGTPDTGARRARAEAKATGAKADRDTRAEAQYKRILLMLRNHSGVDFSLYKSSTIQRRIGRRLVLNKHKTLGEYAAFLTGNMKELEALYSDVLISVTSFFRNPETFEILQRDVLPQILRRGGTDSIRCWVLGCSTGQEAYSVAIAFVEAMEKSPRLRKLQVFATDLNDSLLEKARQGLYAQSLAEDISPQRLRRFFVEEEGGYRVTKMLREMVVFARHNFMSDPPFSHMDLISCRNVLIYLEPRLQKRALPTFHYALKPQGFLLLGASESVGGFTDLFEPVDRKHKIYARKLTPTPAFQVPTTRDYLPSVQGRSSSLKTRAADSAEILRIGLNVQREADRVTLGRYAPPGVLLDDQLQVIQFRGQTSPYLQPPAGRASYDVLKMAREGLLLALRSAIQQAKKEDKPTRRENVRIKQDGRSLLVHLEVIPLRNHRERGLLVLFVDPDQDRRPSGRREPAAPQRRLMRAVRPVATKPDRASELEVELAETREYLQSMQEQYEASNEELQSANEEVQSANEELQSINEELETSKEELESANEELTTLNEEMANRNQELSRLNSDLLNLQNSAKLAIVLLGRDLTIRRFSNQAEKLLDLLATDVGRPISHIRHGLMELEPTGESGHGPPDSAGKPMPLDLDRMCSEVITEVREHQREVRDRVGRWYSLRVCPYLTVDNRIDGAVLVLDDIDGVKRSENAVAASRDRAQKHARELSRFNRVAVGRESRMIELKREVNELRERLGESARYRIEEGDGDTPIPEDAEETR